MTLLCIPIPEPRPWFVCLPLSTNSLTPLATGGYNVSPFLSCLVQAHNSTPSTSATIRIQPFHPRLFQLRTRAWAPTPGGTLLQAASHWCFRIRPSSPVLLRGGMPVVPTMELAHFGLGSKGDCRAYTSFPQPETSVNSEGTLLGRRVGERRPSSICTRDGA
jgi:hypothetical protein